MADQWYWHTRVAVMAAKVLIVHSRRLPGWVLPAAGGTLAILTGVLWYTSALWYYDGFQLPHP